jgi:lipoyl-dependent peroxiredoxin
MISRDAQARWTGTIKEGEGTLRFDGFEGKYTFASRFEQGEGTNPEALIAAAHAGCFSMKLSGVLTNAGITPRSIETTATAHLDTDQGKITRIDLRTRAEVPGLDADAFQRHAEDAKTNCPISKTLEGVDIRLDAELVGA